MYESKVKSKMIINHQTGEVKIEDLGVSVDSYTDSKFLSDAIGAYNSDKVMPEHRYEASDKWPEGTCYKLIHRMFEKLLPWKGRTYKNRKKNRKNKNNKTN